LEAIRLTEELFEDLQQWMNQKRNLT
jgi:hypothetical protein